MEKNRVLVAMSGGVDSSVAAYILKDEGYDVIGITMQVWPDDGQADAAEKSCCSLSAVDDARKVADRLGIPYYVMNFKEVFENKVISYFIDEYLSGRTPNPCIACNRYVKFEELLRRAALLEASYVATGHYARIIFDHSRSRYLLKRSATEAKDQTYALYGMTQQQMEHTLMPIGDYTKEQIREMAKKIGLSVADKPDSQEICFVQNEHYGKFIENRAPGRVKPGLFIDIHGNVLGEHKGIVHYTIGQRKGLGIALSRPMYVVSIDVESNQIILGEPEHILTHEATVEDINLISIDALHKPIKVGVKVRYGAKESLATVYSVDGNEVKIVFDKPERAVTPGQAAVFYQNDEVIGGGTITAVSRTNRRTAMS